MPKKKNLATKDASAPPLRPNPLQFLARMFPAGPPQVDRQEQERLLREHRDQILARTDYLDRLASAFRFDDKLDADLADEVRRGIERHLVKLCELATAVREYAKAGRWSEAWTRYESAERVAVDVDHWIARGRADAGARRTSGQRAVAARAANKARRRSAEETIRAIAEEARRLRRLHPDEPLIGLIKQLQRTRDFDVSARTLRRYLRTLDLNQPPR
jgi:hypothetical protein